MNAPGKPSDDWQTLSRGPFAPIDSAGRALPATIGRYRIIRLLGEGGMGAVYEAEQDQPRRRVALKVIKAAWASSDLLERFERESQALGRLHHPGIAQIYEAGNADSGHGFQPFFAMELIQGEPLIAYSEAHKLNVRERLALMIKVCEGVQHAHQRSIIHRDLKPGNIIVDESGQPKILDFGVARATDSDAQATRQTDMGQLLGTLAYMSPEQVLADPLALDTRSDVYALGVILYQLLAGKMPYTISRQLHEAVQTIRETDPAPLSTVMREYKGDVETIVAKALEKDKARRYASAADLAGDIRRYLVDQPITAKPASTMYQLQKFTRRHKTLVASVGAVFLVLVLGIVASTWEAVQARRAGKKAQQESEIAQAVNDFLQNDLLAQASAFGQSGLNTKADPDMKVRTALDRAAERIQGKFGKQPDVEAAIRETIGQTYYGLGLYPESRKQLEGALELERKVLGPDNPKTVEFMLSLAKTEEGQGKYAEAEALGEQVLEISRGVLGPEHPDTLKAMNLLASVYDDDAKYEQGEAIGVQTVEISQRVLGPEDPNTLKARQYLAIIYYDRGKYAEAEALDSKTLEVRQRVLGPEHPDTLSTMNNLASELAGQGKFAQAEELDHQLLEIRKRVLGPEHPDTLDIMTNLAHDYRDQRKFAQAEELDARTLQIQRRVLGAEHPLTLRSMYNLASDYQELGKYTQAEALDSQTLEAQKRVLGPEHPDTLWTMSDLAGHYRRQYKYAQAEALDSKVFGVRRRVLGNQHPNTLMSMNQLGLDYMALGKYAQAEGLYRKALEANPNSPAILNQVAWFLLACQDHRLRRPGEALELSRRAIKGAPKSLGYLNTLGLAEVRNGLWDEAIATLNQCAETDKGSDPTDFFFLAMARWGSGDKSEAGSQFERGVAAASANAGNKAEWRMFWAESAELLGKPGPVPTLLEAQAEPDRAMERLKRSAAAGWLKPGTLASSPDLAPLRGRPDFQALLAGLRSSTKPAAQ